ncbi:MAG: NAD(P)H-quinone oxidoreductase [Myxococcaceae bacterium]
MQALRILRPGSPEGLELADAPEPLPGPTDLLVQVHATALNRADLLQVLGRYPPPPDVPHDIPGMEYAGTVLAAGHRTLRFKPGDRVMGLVGGGAFAERLVTQEREALPIPEVLSFERAAAVPEAFLTAFDALVLQGGLGPHTRVLVHAAASGVGTAALQLIHTFRGTAIGTARSAAKLERCRQVAPFQPLVVDAVPPRFADRVLALTKGQGVDLVLDLVGGRYLAESLACLAPKGRVLEVGTLDGTKAELDLRQLMGRRAQVVGTLLRSRPLEEKIALARSFEARVLPDLASAAVEPVVDEVFNVRRIHAALERMAQNASVGKLVLVWEEGA